jgi:hypothetical protein
VGSVNLSFSDGRWPDVNLSFSDGMWPISCIMVFHVSVKSLPESLASFSPPGRPSHGSTVVATTGSPILVAPSC